MNRRRPRKTANGRLISTILFWNLQHGTADRGGSKYNSQSLLRGSADNGGPSAAVIPKSSSIEFRGKDRAPQ
ncbi:hypothetical protein BDQ12DRAFT_79238 [Crucibulum laeve]|uniref:Uncharacterized protein n=1 Tax=Crucibulum laeve TaxID=68775 RepID=A0A5C3LG58_9AGAR|nr:hypothetical protein BDQ12DRAFT_79238 [Crucibulum laeve]